VTTARIREQVIDGYQAGLHLDADAINEAPKSIQFAGVGFPKVEPAVGPKIENTQIFEEKFGARLASPRLRSDFAGDRTRSLMRF
jgi:hypothetical protein